MLRSLFKWLAGAVILLLLVVAGLYLYYIALDYPEEPDLAGELNKSTLQVGGHQRSFTYYVPDSLPANPALIFLLHGSKSQGETMRLMGNYGYEEIAEREGLIVVYPDGYENHWNDCRGSANYAANTENIDDPAFFRSMIDFFTDNYSISTDRAFVMGISNGGHMAYRLAFEMPEAFGAFVAANANLPVDETFDCERQNQPVSIAIFNGTKDPVNPYDGGLVTLFGDSSRGEVMSAEDSVRYWVDLANGGNPIVTTFPELDGDPDTHISMAAWQSDQGHLIRLYTLHGSGHVMPSRTTRRVERFLGGSAGDLDGVEEVWRFFRAAEAAREPEK